MGRAGSDTENDYHSSGGHSSDRDCGGHTMSSSRSSNTNSSDSSYSYDSDDYTGSGLNWPLWAVIASIIFTITASAFLYIITHCL